MPRQSSPLASGARLLLLAGCLSGLMPLGLPAQEATPRKPWFETMSLTALVSTSYTYNFNVPDSRKNAFRVFDTDDNSMRLDVAALSLRQKADAPGAAGFRIDITMGSAIPHISRAAGMNMGDLDLLQCYGTYIAPVGNGLQFDAGKFVTSLGFELVELSDGYNNHYTHSFLFGYAIPFTHTGIKSSYAFSDRFSAMVMVANGWDNAVDSNTVKTFCFQITAVPIPGTTLTANCISGAEQTNNPNDRRTVVDVVVVSKLSPLLTGGMNVDIGTEERAAPGGDAAKWFGMAAYMRYDPFSNASLAVRAEFFHDRDGLRTGTAQRLQEITVTPEYRPTDQLVLRADIRRDMSDAAVFQTRGSWNRGQTTVGLNALFIF